jgi:hypothetical protein
VFSGTKNTCTKWKRHSTGFWETITFTRSFTIPAPVVAYDGLEEKNVNLNQGAESTITYLMARLTLEKSLKTEQGITRVFQRPASQDRRIQPSNVQQ